MLTTTVNLNVNLTCQVLKSYFFYDKVEFQELNVGFKKKITFNMSAVISRVYELLLISFNLHIYVLH